MVLVPFCGDLSELRSYDLCLEQLHYIGSTRRQDPTSANAEAADGWTPLWPELAL